MRNPKQVLEGRFWQNAHWQKEQEALFKPWKQHDPASTISWASNCCATRLFLCVWVASCCPFRLCGVVLPWPKKKRTIPKIRGEKNAVPSCDIMLGDARSVQGKSRGQSRMTLPYVDRASSSMISQDRTAFFSPRISEMVLFFCPGSRTCLVYSLLTKAFTARFNTRCKGIDAFPYYCPGVRRGNVFVATCGCYALGRASIQCIQFFFPKLCLILKNRFLARLSSNFQERLLMKYFMPQFIFGVSIFSLRA